MSKEEVKAALEGGVSPEKYNSGQNNTDLQTEDTAPTEVESEPSLPHTSGSPRSQSPEKRVQSDSSLSTSKSSEKEGASPTPSPDAAQQPDRETPQAAGTPLTMSESMRRIIKWTMTGFFDWNPRYFLQLRGIFNVLHWLLSLTCVILLSETCQVSKYSGGPTDEFLCKPPETFLFVISCSAFLTATIYLFCCMLSKRTDALMFETSFEICYFALYFILILTASITLMISAMSKDSDRTAAGYNFKSIQATAIIALVNSIMYGISAICFFISHRYYGQPVLTVGAP